MSTFIEAKKSLGQNFLVDQNIIRNIVAAIDPQEKETIIEIGPGQGALTAHLLAAQAHIIAIEKDERMEEPLTALAAEKGGTLNLNLTDAMNVKFEDIVTTPPVKLVGNLPYNIGTQIVFNALHKPELFGQMTFMLQKEVVERITATAGSSNWGRLGVWCDLFAERKKIFDVPPTAFRPRPKIVSAIVQLTPLEKPRYAVNIKNLELILRKSFGQRRKMLRSSLKGVFTSEQLEAIGISPQCRPETLTTEQFCLLSTNIPT